MENHTGAALLNAKAVAALLSCSPRNIYRLSDGGIMPPGDPETFIAVRNTLAHDLYLALSATRAGIGSPDHV